MSDHDETNADFGYGIQIGDPEETNADFTNFANDPRCGCRYTVAEDGTRSVTQCYTCAHIERLTLELDVLKHELSGCCSALANLVRVTQDNAIMIQRLNDKRLSSEK